MTEFKILSLMRDGRPYFKANVFLKDGLRKQFAGRDRDDLEKRIKAYIRNHSSAGRKVLQSFSSPCGSIMLNSPGRCRQGSACQAYLHCLNFADYLGWKGWALNIETEEIIDGDETEETERTGLVILEGLRSPVPSL